MARPRRLIVDAWNVLHVTGVLEPDRAGPDLTGLADLIAASRWGGLTSVLVCDGKPMRLPALPQRVSVTFSGVRSDADTVIETMIARDSAPRLLRVVSSDRRLQRAARRRHAGWMTSDEFLGRLNHDAGLSRGPRAGAKPPVPVDPGSVATWLTRMGVSSNDPIRAIRSAAGRGASVHPTGSHRANAESDTAPPVVDPVLEAAFEEWRGRLDVDDLDMARWLPDAEPIRPRDDSATPPPSSSPER